MDLRIGWEAALLSMVLSLLLSMAIAWVYAFTYQGLSYSRGFVQTLAIGGVVAAIVMLAIGNDIARGLGLVGALTVVRFRTTLKDSRDMIFIFASLAIGVACGVQAFQVALLGTAVFGVAQLYLGWSTFGSRRHFDAVLRLHLPASPEADRACRNVLEQHCRTWVLINLRAMGAAGSVQEHSYHVKLVDPDRRGRLVEGLNAVPGLSGVTLLMQDTTIEV